MWVSQGRSNSVRPRPQGQVILYSRFRSQNQTIAGDKVAILSLHHLRNNRALESILKMEGDATKWRLSWVFLYKV